MVSIAQVSVFGSQQYAVRIQVDPNKLAAYGLGIDQVEQAVEQGNVDQQRQHAMENIGRSSCRPAASRNTAAAFVTLTVASSFTGSNRGAAARVEERPRRRSKRQSRRVVLHVNERHARGRAGHSTAAGRKHGQSRGQHQKNAATIPRAGSGGGETGNSFRPFAVIRASVSDVEHFV